MNIKLHNTLTRKLEIFKPIKKGSVGLYTCGPTVYNYAHIGNLRTYVFEDILKRVLLYNDYKVKHVMNITDVGHLTSDADEGEDKMEKGAKRENKTAWEIAEFYTQAFKNDMEDLNLFTPSKWCKATDHIKEQINLIKKLEKKEYTYKTSDGVYFDSSKLKDYGKLANLKKQKLKAGVRVDLGEKKNITDFALWKFSNKNEKRQMEWKSPWGIGFPGWHLECSAMSVKYLNQPFDIHCGGIDHIPVHHTNEIAQSEAAFDKPLANYWLHGEFLIVKDGKMAKSANNFITLQTIKDKNITPLAYRYFLLQTHYRKELKFSWKALEAAENGLKHLYNSARKIEDKNVGIGLDLSSLCNEGVAINNKQSSFAKATADTVKDKFLKLINNNLDTPNALALIWKALKDKKINLDTLLKFDEVLGLKIKENLNKKEKVLPAEIQKILDERNKARKNKDWKKSDELREKLEKTGYIIEDTKIGTKITQNLHRQ